MKPIRLLLIGILYLALLFLGLSVLVWVAVEAFTPPMDYVVVAEFRELPPTDDDLKQWLLKQPGVYIGFVQRDGNKVSLIWGNAATSYSDPVTPTVRDKFEQLGYKGIVSYKEHKDYRDK